MAFTSSSMLLSSEIDSLELVSLYVKSYKTLKDKLINLNPRFHTKYDDGILHIDENKEYIRKEAFSNVKLLCGENGVGKTSILELLRNHSLSNGCILVMKTTSDKFISNNKVVINFNGNTYNCNVFDRELKFGELSLSQSTLYEEEMDFRRYILNFYVKEKKLFDDIDRHLFTHFKITHWPGEDLSSLMLDGIRRNLSVNINPYDLEILREEDLFSYLFYRHFGDNTFEDWVDANSLELRHILKNLNDSNAVEILIRVRKVFFAPDIGNKIFEVINKIESIIDKEYLIKDFKKIAMTFGALVRSFDKLMSQPCRSKHVHQWGGEVSSVFYFRGYKKIESDKRFLENLSRGEFISIRNRCHLYTKMLQHDSAIILEDEPDLHLHPEWARIFVENFFNTVQHIRAYLSKRDERFKNKIYNFVLTTHSPLILTDFFNEEVIFFQKIEDNVYINDSTSCCFAGNIGDLLMDNFFLSKTIGAYAEKMINEIIKIMDGINEENAPTSKDIEHVKFVISQVGDKLLKRLLEDKFARIVKCK